MENNNTVDLGNKLIITNAHLIESWYTYASIEKTIRPIEVDRNISDIKVNISEVHRKYVREFFPNETYENKFEKLRDHLLVLALGSLDLNFIRKTRTITMAEIRYDSSEPFCAIETEDGETYYFSYNPAQNTEYCLCSEEDEGYHQENDCVGIHCDWHIPVITKVHPDGKITEFLYQGLQRDLW